jgi:uroporphyrinogen III methyltransferase/synthase
VTLVAVGPGDPELLTLRAVAALADAEVVICDADAVPIAERFAPDAVIETAIDGNGLPLTRNARAKKVVSAARKGAKVVRLMAGDPVLDGGLTDEGEVLHRNEVRFEVVPGASTLSGWRPTRGSA